MSIQRRNHILEMVEQDEGHLDEALRLVQATADRLFGPLLRTLDAVDAATAATLLGDGAELTAYAALLSERADLHARRGDARRDDARRARSDRRRALELCLERAHLASPLDDRTRAAVQALRAHVNEHLLAERYRAVLHAFPMA